MEPVNPRNLDAILQRLDALEAENKGLKKIIEQQDKKIQEVVQSNILNEKVSRKPKNYSNWDHTKDVVPGVGKIALKLGTKTLLKTPFVNKLLLKGAGQYLLSTSVAKSILNAKIVTKITGKSGSEMIGKKVPILSAVLGLGFGIKRFYDGEVLKGFGEITSGFLGCVPGAGTYCSVGIDLALMADDIRLTKNEHDEIVKKQTNDSYEILGFENGYIPSKEEVDHNYRHLSLDFHEDRQIKDLNEMEYTKEQLKEIRKAISEAKSWIYDQRQWK